MIKDRMETRTLSDGELRRIITLMQDYGSIAYAHDRATQFVMAATLDLASFEESSPRRALSIVAELYGQPRSLVQAVETRPQQMVAQTTGNMLRYTSRSNRFA